MKRPRIRLLIPALALLAMFLLSFSLGRYNVPLTEVTRILVNRMSELFGLRGLTQTWTDNMGVAVLNVRLPRILLACMVGCCLSAAGASFQGVFQNPMAAPDLLGASSGACFGMALAIVLGAPRAYIAISAFLFSLATIALVYLINLHTGGSRTVNLLLAGIMVGSLFSSGTSYLKLVADPTSQLPEITYWLMGSLSGARMSDIRFVFFPMLAGLAPLLLLHWRINVLTLGEEEARSLGVNTGRLRLAVIICATLITAAGVSVSGMIGWVGLVIPNLCRKYVGNDYRVLMPASMIFGAIFLLLVDNVSRNLLATEIPIGILTSFIGAPFFIRLMTRREAIL